MELFNATLCRLSSTTFAYIVFLAGLCLFRLGENAALDVYKIAHAGLSDLATAAMILVFAGQMCAHLSVTFTEYMQHFRSRDDAVRAYYVRALKDIDDEAACRESLRATFEATGARLMESSAETREMMRETHERMRRCFFGANAAAPSSSSASSSAASFSPQQPNHLEQRAAGASIKKDGVHGSAAEPADAGDAKRAAPLFGGAPSPSSSSVCSAAATE